MSYYNEALSIVREVGDRAGEAATLNNIGGVHHGLGDRARALTYYNEALPILREVGARAGQAVTRFNVAMIHRGEGRLGEAVAELGLVVELNRQVKHPESESAIAMLQQVRAELAERGDRPSGGS